MSVIELKVTLKYSCALCGVKRAEVPVPARGPEDVVAWLKGAAIPVLMNDHARRSPGCRAQEFSEVMIPTTGTDRIGEPPKN